MNYIKHLTGFFSRIAFEESLNPTHISLYLTLFQCWNINRFKNPITISRDEMMKGSKIASKATYHKCIKELQRLQFLDYQPSYNPYSGTQVFMFNFSDGTISKTNFEETTNSKFSPTKPNFDQTEPKNEHVNGQVREQVNEPLYIYNKQTLKNNKNIDIDTNFEIENENLFLEENLKEEKSSAKKEEKNILGAFEKPNLQLVKKYFQSQNSNDFEAERFFNYYSSIGWLIAGKTIMKDWQASARNWMLNTSKFTINQPTNSTKIEKSQNRPYNLNATTDKNYAEPL